MSRLEAIEKRLLRIEAELEISVCAEGCLARDEAEDKALSGPQAARTSDWRSSPDLYRTPAPWETQPQWRATCGT